MADDTAKHNRRIVVAPELRDLVAAFRVLITRGVPKTGASSAAQQP